MDAHLWHHCRQLGDLLRVAGGVGSDTAAEAVDGRAKAMQLDVVDDEEPVVEVVGVGDGETLVLAVVSLQCQTSLPH